MSAAATMVVSVGTYFRAFDRLVDWLDPWLARNQGVHVVMQHGSTRAIAGADNRTTISPEELVELYRRADYLVLQGGAGGVMDARRAFRIPIVVPRIPVNGEVIDNHQLVLAEQLEAMGLIHEALSAQALWACLDAVTAGTLSTRTDDVGPTPGVAAVGRLLTSLPVAASGMCRFRRMTSSSVALLSRHR